MATPTTPAPHLTPEIMMQNNREWAAEISAAKPGFFEKLAQRQVPEVLWIGCADSRVPANELLKLGPGEVFVHRNIANIVQHADLNCLSVLQYAVDVLKVRHIIVCGHYGCGGVAAALQNQQFGIVDNWIRTVKELYSFHAPTLKHLTESEKCDRMVEINCSRSAHAIAYTSIVQNAWKRGQKLTIYGWCYRLNDGILQDIGVRIEGIDEVDGVHRVV
ncbi:carbonic anhydrase [Fimicolochytrium jonesii]|uniref:carbonic anhydrase n=1 Tax=Fimicolochytrium jonesii TaxID=1396493 RepID=UPI0022FDF490|nr:carbonic anhydrase [Fimicolochytrium jonesii]KAI8821702.1 carbonic anhydrase [Fimicolochytrium jonesii]